MVESTFISKDLKSVNKVITVLKYLNQGRSIELDGWTIKLAETEADGFALMWKTEENEWFGLDMTIRAFSENCAKLTDEEITIMQAEMALQGFNKKDR